VGKTNFRCARSSRIYIPNPNFLSYSFRDPSVHMDGQTDEQTERRTDGQTHMATSTRLVILIKNIYSLWGRKRFLLPVTTQLVILIKNIYKKYTRKNSQNLFALYGRKRFILPVTHFSTNLFPFTLQVTNKK